MATSTALGEPKMMPSILVVDDDPTLRETLTRDLRAHGYHARSASGFHEAVQCSREHVYDVLLTDARMEGGDGVGLIQALREASPGTRPVFMSAHATARDGQRAMDLGAVRVLSKPFDTVEMLQAVERAAEHAGGFLANLHGLALVDTLQMFHYSRRSLTVRVMGETPAAIHMQSGELVHAECGKLRGEAAVAAVLKMPAGLLRTSAAEAVKPTIFREFEAVLLAQLTRLDEEERDSHVHDAVEPFGDALFADFDLSTKTSVPALSTLSNPTGVSGERPIIRLPEARKTLEKIDVACERVVTLANGAVACGVIDLATGALLGIYNSADSTGTQNDLVAEATMDLFRGPNVARVHALVRDQRADANSSEHFVEEIQLTSKHNLHFAKTLKEGRAVIMLITKRSTGLGMGWAQLKAAIPVLERLIP